MIEWGAAALMAAALGNVSGEPRPASHVQLAQVTIRRQIMLRIPLQSRPKVVAAAKGNPILWKEKRRGPKCVAARSIVAATALSQKSVDLILRDRTRLRARLERNCPALDYYYGFYVARSADGMICADRDPIRSRVGGECGIDGFRGLKASLKD